VEPRKQWPSGLPDVKGRITDERRALPGRALAVAGDGVWSPLVDAAFDAFDTSDTSDGADPTAAAGDGSALDDELVDGLVAVLGRWGWPAGRPRWITWVPSRRRGALLAALAHRLGSIGKLPVHEVLSRTRDAPRQSSRQNSVHACANVRGAFAMAGEVPAGPVLVLDDTTSSGWTMTVVADLLGGAGASPVYPLFLRRD
jgi:ATP-dependent DNA helicase RecQ